MNLDNHFSQMKKVVEEAKVPILVFLEVVVVWCQLWGILLQVSLEAGVLLILYDQNHFYCQGEVEEVVLDKEQEDLRYVTMKYQSNELIIINGCLE